MMSALHLADCAGLEPAEYAQIAATVRGHYGLDDVIAWGRAQVPPVYPADVVRQDEFNHDVLVPLPSGRWIVYGTTCLAGVRTVSVWSHRPSAAELLERRLAWGWRPTASELRDGAAVEGYAACMFTAGGPREP